MKSSNYIRRLLSKKRKQTNDPTKERGQKIMFFNEIIHRQIIWWRRKSLHLPTYQRNEWEIIQHLFESITLRPIQWLYHYCPPPPAHTHLQPPSPTRDSRDGDRLSFMGAVVHLHHLIVCLCHVFTVLEHFFFVFKWRKRVEMIMLMFDPAWCWWHFSFCVCSVVASVFVSQPAVKKTVSPFLPYLPSTRFIRTRDFFYLKKKKKTFKKVRKVKKKKEWTAAPLLGCCWLKKWTKQIDGRRLLLFPLSLHCIEREAAFSISLPSISSTHTHTGGEQLKETHRCDNSMRKIIIYALADDEICFFSFMPYLPPPPTSSFHSEKVKCNWSAIVELKTPYTHTKLIVPEIDS